jgi:myosin protein heavy chain
MQIDRRDKANTQLEEEVARSRDRCEKFLKTIDELQNSDSANQLAARKAERELRDEREKALRLERELEGWKQLRMEKGSSLARGNVRGSGTWSGVGGSGAEENGIEIPKRRSSVSRQTSLSKGFL